MAVTMPDDIAADPVQREIWALLAPDGNRFAEQDVPNLSLLCFWHAVAMEARRQMSKGGKPALFDPISVKPFAQDNGKPLFMVRKSPALAVLKEATAEIRLLSDMLGVSPSARSRMGAESAPRRDGAKADLLTLVLTDRSEKERKAVGA